MVEEIARIESGVAHELEDGAMHSLAAGLGNDVDEARGPTADFGGHYARAGIDLLDGIHVEIGEGGATHFGIGGIHAVHGEHRGCAALAIHCILFGEI